MGLYRGLILGVDDIGGETQRVTLEWWEYQDGDQAWIDDAATLTLEGVGLLR